MPTVRTTGAAPTARKASVSAPAPAVTSSTVGTARTPGGSVDDARSRSSQRPGSRPSSRVADEAACPTPLASPSRVSGIRSSGGSTSSSSEMPSTSRTKYGTGVVRNARRSSRSITSPPGTSSGAQDSSGGRTGRRARATAAARGPPGRMTRPRRDTGHLAAAPPRRRSGAGGGPRDGRRARHGSSWRDEGEHRLDEFGRHHGAPDLLVRADVPPVPDDDEVVAGASRASSRRCRSSARGSGSPRWGAAASGPRRPPGWRRTRPGPSRGCTPPGTGPTAAGSSTTRSPRPGRSPDGPARRRGCRPRNAPEVGDRESTVRDPRVFAGVGEHRFERPDLPQPIGWLRTVPRRRSGQLDPPGQRPMSRTPCARPLARASPASARASDVAAVDAERGDVADGEARRRRRPRADDQAVERRLPGEAARRRRRARTSRCRRRSPSGHWVGDPSADVRERRRRRTRTAWADRGERQEVEHGGRVEPAGAQVEQ